tara:strand:+ start:402 stop:1010 length:609 start_codon:yes stop_codon:yes gene_type:complete
MNQLQKANVKTKIIELTTELKGDILIILKHYMDHFGIVAYGNSPFSIDTLHGNQEWFAKVAQHLLFMHGYAIYMEGKLQAAAVLPIDTIIYNMWVAEVWKEKFQIKVKRYWKEHEKNNELRLRHNKGEIPLFLMYFPKDHSPTDNEIREISEAARLFFADEKTTSAAYILSHLGDTKEASGGERKETSSGKYKKDNTNTLIF